MKRNINGEGTIWFDKSRGTYLCRITYTTESGERKKKSFTAQSAAAAKKRADDWRKLYEESLHGPGDNPLIESWINEWLNVYIKPAVRPATFEKYFLCLKPIRETFGLKRLNSITAVQLQRFFNKQLTHGGNKEQGLSAMTVRNQRTYFSACMEMAVKLGYLPMNPVKLTKPPRIEKKPMEPLTYEEAQKVLAQAYANYTEATTGDDLGRIISDADLYIGVFIALETGMRLGEISALMWSDIQEKCYLTVQRSKSDVPGQNITTTKTGVGRNILINQELYKALMEHKKLQTAYRKTMKSLYKNENRIIGGLYGHGYYNRHFSSRKFQHLLKQVGITRKIRFHDLRHTNATIMLIRGVSPKIVQERLGHSSIDVTMDTYSHLLLSDQSKAITVFDELSKNFHNKN